MTKYRSMGGRLAQVALAACGAAMLAMLPRVTASRRRARDGSLFQLGDDALRGSPLLLFQQDRDLRFTRIQNPPPEVTREQVLGKRDSEVLATGIEGQRLEAIKRKVLWTGKGTHEEICLHVRGVDRYYDLIVEPTRNERGQIIGVMGAAVDITPRKKIEAALRESEARLRFAQEAVGVGLWDWDLTNNHCVWSEACYRLHGFEPGAESPTYERWLAALHPDDRQFGGELLHGVTEGDLTDYQAEYRVVYDEGRVRWLAAKGKVVRDDEGHALRTTGILFDITDRKRAEEERAELLEREQEARRAAEAANRAKDEFLAVLSHELRTPLTSIVGWTQMLRRGDLDTTTRARGLEVIERNAMAQRQLIEDLLDVSRIISGKLALDMKQVEITPAVEEASMAIKPAAEAKQIDFTWRCETVGVRVFGDPNRLQQVIYNLISNAIKFTPSGGRVAVEAQQEDGQVMISISDTGIGISPEFLPHLFERFRQADSSITRQYQGLGLGLAIVRHLVELHGGTVQAHSEGKGQGAMFTVRLPISRACEKGEGMCDDPATPHAALSTDLRGVRVLVVEDEADSRDFLCTALSQHGAETSAVASAADALAEIERAPPHALLSDIGLPGEDGYTLIRKVRELPPERGGATPAIALTAYARPEDRERALTAGYQAHLAKPVNPDEIVSWIGRLARPRSSQ